jgi:hypothetical protein
VVRIGADDSIALAMRRLAERHIGALVVEDRPDDRSAGCYGRRASIHQRSGSACRDRFGAVTELAGGWILVGTDVGSIGETTVGEDGLYVVYEGRIAKCGVPL